MKEFDTGIFIFRRDLRLNDNTGLNEALSTCKKVISVFIFDPRQIGNKNQYRSANAIQFMVASLEELAQEIKKKGGRLSICSGQADEVVKKLLNETGAEAVFVNQDYTPFSIKRDKAIAKVCNSNNVQFIVKHDALLFPPGVILTGAGTPYSVYTPFYKTTLKAKIAKPARIVRGIFASKKLEYEDSTILKKVVKKENDQILVSGGRKEAVSILKKLKNFKNYQKERDFPSIETTHLSAHHKFGTISIRESYHAIVQALGKGHGLLRQLVWRDFFYHVGYFSPFVYGQSFHKKYDKLKWSYSKKNFDAWCAGKTGFPIVDAGMRQLNAIGWMHNRTRMIVASFLTKDLHIDWRWGEKYFAQQLIDYDPAVNNGSWQWAASTGCDAQPYFRIFNPWLQQKKFDPDCEYIKTWVQELEDVPVRDIHNYFKGTIDIPGYPKPIVEHKNEAEKSKQMFKAV